MATGTDLGIRPCLWATCPKVSTELVETRTGVVIAVCSDHGVHERAMALRKENA